MAAPVWLLFVYVVASSTPAPTLNEPEAEPLPMVIITQSESQCNLLHNAAETHSKLKSRCLQVRLAIAEDTPTVVPEVDK